MSDTYRLECFGCGHEFSLGNFVGEASCPHCGLRYIYDEGHSPDEMSLIRTLAKHSPALLLAALAAEYGVVRMDEMGMTFAVPAGAIFTSIKCVEAKLSLDTPDPSA